MVASLVATAATASPPPPPPAYIVEIAKQLVSTPTAATFDDFAANFADDLSVSVDGQQVAGSKAAWLAVERDRLGKVDRKVLGYAEGHDSILVVDLFDDRSDPLTLLPNLHFDARYETRATQYQVGADHLIHAIRIVRTDGIIRLHR